MKSQKEIDNNQTTIPECIHRRCRLWWRCVYRGKLCPCDGYHDPLKHERLFEEDFDYEQRVPALSWDELDIKKGCVKYKSK